MKSFRKKKRPNKIPGNNGHVILICGGSCSGKSSAVKYLKKIASHPCFMHLDYDNQIIKLCNDKYGENIREAIEFTISKLAVCADQTNLVMDHWMPPEFEKTARTVLLQHKTFYVWLYCTSQKELIKRDAQRYEKEDHRGEGITEAGAKENPRLPYDCKIDTFQKKPKEVAELIYKKARRHWKYI